VKKTDMGNFVPSFKKAYVWCIEHYASISIKPESFSRTKVRVTVRAGGYNPVERDSLEECIADIERYKIL
jgi:hypothetical protein